MSDLWIFGRKPAATIRYRHGGFNATFPMNGHTVIEQAGIELERAAVEAAERERPARAEGRDAHNVISFAERSRHKRNSPPTRPGKRPGPYRD